LVPRKIVHRLGFGLTAIQEVVVVMVVVEIVVVVVLVVEDRVLGFEVIHHMMVVVFELVVEEVDFAQQQQQEQNNFQFLFLHDNHFLDTFATFVEIFGAHLLLKLEFHVDLILYESVELEFPFPVLIPTTHYEKQRLQVHERQRQRLVPVFLLQHLVPMVSMVVTTHAKLSVIVFH
jgi:hypothetical protein